MEESFRYFCNKKCEYFPCHPGADVNNFNCLFCYCPLYHEENCGGHYYMLPNGVKDCTGCRIPHEDYDYVLNYLMKGSKEK